MSGFIQGEDRDQATLFPESLDEYADFGACRPPIPGHAGPLIPEHVGPPFRAMPVHL